MMFQLRLGVCWIRAGENAPYTDNGEYQNTVINLTLSNCERAYSRHDTSYIVE